MEKRVINNCYSFTDCSNRIRIWNCAWLGLPLLLTPLMLEDMELCEGKLIHRQNLLLKQLAKPLVPVLLTLPLAVQVKGLVKGRKLQSLMESLVGMMRYRSQTMTTMGGTCRSNSDGGVTYHSGLGVHER